VVKTTRASSRDEDDEPCSPQLSFEFANSVQTGTVIPVGKTGDEDVVVVFKVVLVFEVPGDVVRTVEVEVDLTEAELDFDVVFILEVEVVLFLDDETTADDTDFALDVDFKLEDLEELVILGLVVVDVVFDDEVDDEVFEVVLLMVTDLVEEAEIVLETVVVIDPTLLCGFGTASTVTSKTIAAENKAWGRKNFISERMCLVRL